MLTESDPYEAPRDHTDLEPFSHWSTIGLVGLFFLPSLCLSLTLITVVLLKTGSLVLAGLCLTAVSGISVSVFSAYVHTVRRKATRGTLALFIFVYLLAQILALFITWFGLFILTSLLA